MRKSKLAFIGLGTMGYPMAGHLVREGFEVSVFNRTIKRAEEWVAEYSGSLYSSPAEAAEDADFVLVCVGGDKDVREVSQGEEGVFTTMKKGAVLIDHTTASAILARDLAKEAQQLGLFFLDAPVSGGQAGAEKGVLTVMCGGEEEIFRLAQPIFRAYASTIELIGDVGCGQLAKMVNQICIAGLVQALAEGIEFGSRAQLDMEKVMRAISKGAAQSWQLENRHKTMLEDKFDFGFAVDWMRKDLAMALGEASRIGVSLPVTQLVDSFYAELQREGGGRWDTSSLIKRLR